MKYLKLRYELERYTYDSLPVFRMSVSDQASGLLLNSRLISGNFESWEIEYETPLKSAQQNAPGVLLASPFDKHVLCYLVLTLDRKVEVLSNDEFVAKRIFVDKVFGGQKNFLAHYTNLSVFEEWTYLEPWKGIFESKVKSRFNI